jgi:hypothetical protein
MDGGGITCNNSEETTLIEALAAIVTANSAVRSERSRAIAASSASVERFSAKSPDMRRSSVADERLEDAVQMGRKATLSLKNSFLSNLTLLEWSIPLGMSAVIPRIGEQRRHKLRLLKLLDFDVYVIVAVCRARPPVSVRHRCAGGHC